MLIDEEMNVLNVSDYNPLMGICENVIFRQRLMLQYVLN